MNRVTQDGRVVPHWGLDIAAPPGTPVRAAKSGVVLLSRPVRGYGNTVMIRHDNDRRSTLYAHLQRAYAREGTHVGGDEVIATVGGTRHGRNVRWDGSRFISVGPESAGAVSSPISPHIHFEVHPGPIPRLGSAPRRLDPVAWLRQEGIEPFGAEWERGGAVPRVA